MRHLLILLCSCLLIACQPTEPAEEPTDITAVTQLGEVDFAATGDAAAQPDFKRGVLLLHSFEYDDAREAFQAAQAIDPAFVMAYWGEAMTHHHPLWRQQDKEAALAALAKIAPTEAERLAQAGSDLEKEWLRAAHILFGEGQKADRNLAYAEYLAKMHEKHPRNHEVAAFYALSLLGAVPVGRDSTAYGKGARIAQGILQENPQHPGALHYLIHSYDDPDHAHLALSAADRYAKVAPSAAHALHMPSHIYVAEGMWDEVISSNIASWEASVDRMERKDLDNNARSYHALHWLMYGHLQRGEYDRAKALLLDMQRYVTELPSERARDYLISMQSSYLLENDEWDAEMADLTVDLTDLNITTCAARHFVEGMTAYHAGQSDSLAAIIARMNHARKQAEQGVSDTGVPMCSAGGSGRKANQLDIDEAHVRELQLRALQARAKGDAAAAEKWMRQATQLESSISYAYGPPPIAWPTYEMYGDWLHQQGRTDEALAQYEYALEKGPNRRRAVAGKAAAIQ